MSEKPQPIPTYSNENVILESVYYLEQPKFLLWDGGAFTLVDEYATPTGSIRPLRKGKQREFPYRPYLITDEVLKHLNDSELTNEEAFRRLKDVYADFVDVDDVYLTLEALSDMLSYQQHKTMTVPYLYMFGPKGSGKTNRCMVHNYLAYRPMLSIDVTPANIYSYLGAHEEGAGTIIEDEFVTASGEANEDKIRMYLPGYKKGLSAARLSFIRGARQQDFFVVFGVKWFTGRQLPTNDNFLDRCIVYPIYRGSPPKDEFKVEDESHFDNLRVLLLGWRMKTYFDALPEIDINIPGRLKELFKPLFRIGDGIGGVVGDLLYLLEQHQAEKERELTNDPEYWIVNAVWEATQEHGNPLPFYRIWNSLMDISGAVEDARGKLTCPEWEVTKTFVGRKLGRLLQGTKSRQLDKHGQVVRTYRFDLENLAKVVESYGLESEK